MKLSRGYHAITDVQTLQEKVDAAAKVIKNWIDEGNPITHIVAIGISGQSVAWPTAYKLGIPVCVVRKENDESHGSVLTGHGELGDYAIIDDMIDSGKTIRYVEQTIRKSHEKDLYYPGRRTPQLKHIFLFHHSFDDDYSLSFPLIEREFGVNIDVPTIPVTRTNIAVLAC